MAYQALNFFAFLAALIAFASPLNSFSAPTFFPLVGQPLPALHDVRLMRVTVNKINKKGLINITVQLVAEKLNN
jgi:hypothetical protein